MGKKTILYAEDNEALLKSKSDWLEDYDYNVLRAKNGAEAYSLYKQHQKEINLVLTDNSMLAENDGIALTRKIREEDATLPVIINSNDVIDLENYGDLGNTHIFSKSRRSSDLNIKIKELLGITLDTKAERRDRPLY